jgi:hypothetical protein
LREWGSIRTLVAMLSIAALLSHTATRRSVVGALAQDPVVTDTDNTSDFDAARHIGRFDDGLATRPGAVARRRIGTFADGTTRHRPLEADTRRVA